MNSTPHRVEPERIKPGQSGADFASNPGAEDFVKGARLDLLFKNLPLGITVHFLTSFLTLALFWEIVSRSGLLIWFSLVLLASLYRSLMLRNYRNDSSRKERPGFWESQYTLGAGLSGIAWGTLVLLLFRGEPIVYQVFASFVLGGMVVGSVAINSVLPKAFMAFTLPIVVLLMGRFFIEGETVYSLMGIMTLIFTGAMFAAAFQFRALTERSLRLGFENHEMFLRLSEEIKRTAQLSEELTDQTWKDRQIQEAVRFIAEKTVDKTGQGFFDSLTQHLATAFRVKYAFLMKLDPKEKDRGRVFSFWSGSGFEKSFEFRTQAPPFNKILTGDVVHFPTGAGRLFVPEAGFVSTDIEGLLAFPLKDSEGRLVGQICLMHHRIIPKNETHLSVLKLFSIRVIGEIQRQRFENDLRVFRSLIDRANDAVFIIDPEEARFVDVNQKAIDRLGYTSKELSGMSVFDVSLGMRGKKDWGEIVRKLKEVSSMTLEGTHRRKNGSTFPVEIGASFISFGEKEFVVAVARDITSRRKTEAALARVSRQSELILVHSEEGICGLDEEGNLSFLNPAGARMLGWEPEELIGKPKHEILHHTRADKNPYPLGECQISAALRDGTVHHSRGEVFWRKDKTSFPVEYTSSPIREEGRVTGAVVVFRDITKIIKEEEARVRLLVQGNERLSALGELVSGVSHEVRNPLFSISATLDAFEAKFGEKKEFDRYLNILRRATRKLLVLMEDLLDYGRPPKMEIVPSALSPVFKKAIQDFDGMVKDSGVKIVIPELKPEIFLEMDPNRIAQVFQNLFENGVQSSPQGGRVVVECREISRDGSAWVECRISDSGKGFEEGEEELIFEPFYTRRTGGTGLGLAIVRRLIEEHGGSVSAENKPGGGGMVTVLLPTVSPRVKNNA